MADEKHEGKDGEPCSDKETPTSGAGHQGKDELAKPPTPPTNVIATSGIGCITVSWTRSQAGTFNVYRSQFLSDPSPGQIERGLTDVSCKDTSVTPGQLYYYRATTVFNGVESPFSTETQQSHATASLQERKGEEELARPPSPPVNVIATGEIGDISVSWTPVQPGPSNLYRSQFPNDSNPDRIESGLTHPTCKDTSVTPSQVYYYRATTVGPDGTESRLSNESDRSHATAT